MNIFFGGWEQVARAVITAPIVYAAVVLFIRMSGKRSTSQMNNFDWIVTVAMGSMVASAIIMKDTGVATVLAGLGALLVIQWTVTKTLTFSPLAKRLIKARPTLLYYQGEFLKENMASERVLEAEIMAAVRESGFGTLDDVGAVILETDADLSVIPRADGRTLTSLDGVSGLPDELSEALRKRP